MKKLLVLMLIMSLCLFSASATFAGSRQTNASAFGQVQVMGDVSGGGSRQLYAPILFIGDDDAEDASITFLGNAQDFYVCEDDSADTLIMGVGSTCGTTPAITINSSQAVTLSGAITQAANLTLDDGSGDSPSLILTDEENYTGTITLTNGTSYLTVALSNASGAVNVTGGNLAVGNGTPNTTLNGEDAYIEGTLEVDGSLNFDGAADFASTIAGAGNITLDDGSGASPSIVLIDETDETYTVLKSNTTPGNVTSTFSNASAALQVTTGNFRVGNGANDTTLNGEDAYVEGTLEVDGATNFDGSADFASTIAGAGNVTLDDGSGASPSIILIDETDETYTVLKSNTTPGNVTATFSNASSAYQVTTGNLRVGNGTNDTTLDGEDAYIEGTLEVDGALNFDGAADFASTITGAGNVTLDDGTAASPSIILIDETDETFTVLKSNTTPGNVTATLSNASAAVQVTTGNLRVGNGANDVTLDGEDAYIEGTLEVDGAINFDGALVVNGSTTLGDAVTDGLTVTAAILGNVVMDGTTDDTNETTVTVGDPAGDSTVCIGGSGCAEIVATTNVITDAECGKTFYLNAAGGFDSTLPAVGATTLGCHFTFYVKAAPSGGDYQIITGNTHENVLHGFVLENETDTGDDGPATNGTPVDTVDIKDGVADIGDRFDFDSDGVLWFLTGFTNTDGGATLTTQ